MSRISKLAPELDRNVRLGWWVWKRYFRNNIPALTKEDMQDLRQHQYLIAVESLKFFPYQNYEKQLFRFANKMLYAFCKQLGLRKPKHNRSFAEKYYSKEVAG